MSSSAITSEIANRPPARSTRAASASTFGLSPERLTTQLDVEETLAIERECCPFEIARLTRHKSMVILRGYIGQADRFDGVAQVLRSQRL
jgi:hypothetical protein